MEKVRSCKRFREQEKVWIWRSFGAGDGLELEMVWSRRRFERGEFLAMEKVLNWRRFKAVDG